MFDVFLIFTDSQFLLTDMSTDKEKQQRDGWKARR